MASTSTSSLAACFRRAAVAGSVMLVALCAADLRTASPRFYPDDPLWTDDDRAFDASKISVIEDTNGYDFLINTFGNPGERRDVRALNVNSVDEVPDSSWFTNRIGRSRMSLEEVVRGPDRLDRVTLEGWVVSGGKSGGIQPGFRMTDRSRSALSNRGRSPFEPGTGVRCRDDRHRLLSRARLQRRRRVRG